jgi:hypothetical protein
VVLGQFWETKGQGKRFRCNPCNVWRKRLSTALLETAEEVRVSFKEDFTTEQQRAFKDRNQNTLAKDLPASLEAYVEEETVGWHDKSVCATGHFKDQEDLDEKYKNKPVQLANIYKNAPSHTCDIRGVTLWEDPDLKTKDETGEGTRMKAVRQLRQQQVGYVKKVKVAPSRGIYQTHKQTHTHTSKAVPNTHTHTHTQTP